MSDSHFDAAFELLRAELGDRFMRPGDDGYESARTPWNLAFDLRPAAVALPASAGEVAVVVRAASASGLKVAPFAAGHGAGALAATSDLHDVILCRMTELTGVEVDPAVRTARILGGTEWIDVVRAAIPYGLIPLHGSAADVSAIGYLLGGGLSFYARRHGLAVNTVRAIEVVTADGQLLRATADEHADLFWALRGGAGAFGVVTAVEIDLLPYADVVAGMLAWDYSRAAEVLPAWRDWAATAPESATTSLRIMHLPDIPELPPFLAGRSLITIDGAIVADDDEALRILEPLRLLAPEIDSFHRIPTMDLLGVHMDPPEPSPGIAAHSVLASLPDEAIAVLLAQTRPETGLLALELRQLGGQAGVRPPHAGAIGHIEGEFALFALNAAPTPEMKQRGLVATAAAIAAATPWQADSLLVTFIESATDIHRAYGESVPRLVELAERYDPKATFVSARPVR